jgi:UDP-galactose transporter
MIPAALYVLQNNLTFIATNNLPAEIYQVLSNMKIMSTALFTTIVLNKPQTGSQWTAIFILATGIAAVQLSQEQDSSKSSESSVNTHISMFFGLLSVTGAALISGFAGVYFEMVLKNSNCSIWVRNIQLALISIVFSGIGCYMNDAAVIAEKGFFFGYDHIVYAVITIGAAGGIIVAVVIKFLNNILKGFASGCAILLSCAISQTIIHDESSFNFLFIAGTFLVSLSVLGYAVLPQHKGSDSSSVTNTIDGSKR